MVCGRAGIGLFMVDKSKSMEILLDQVSLSVFIALLISTVTTLYLVCRFRKRKVSVVFKVVLMFKCSWRHVDKIAVHFEFS